MPFVRNGVLLERNSFSKFLNARPRLQLGDKAKNAERLVVS